MHIDFLLLLFFLTFLFPTSSFFTFHPPLSFLFFFLLGRLHSFTFLLIPSHYLSSHSIFPFLPLLPHTSLPAVKQHPTKIPFGFPPQFSFQSPAPFFFSSHSAVWTRGQRNLPTPSRPVVITSRPFTLIHHPPFLFILFPKQNQTQR
ncbi:hypothetical protein F5H01DRAFT_169529 [Linnemannia elongata]|nr:hypothetical protein F5H01DRAFT_169529 [Linnemannia elongata]